MEKKRYSITKHELVLQKNNISSIADERKKSGPRIVQYKQSNFLNYKKQINSSKNTGITNSSNLTSNFYSSKSAIENSKLYNQDASTMIELQPNEKRQSKPKLHKKLENKQKESIPNNYSVITNNIAHCEELLAGK